MQMTMKQAKAWRAAMETAAVSLDDRTASTAPDMFPRLKGGGEPCESRDEINWNGTVKRAAVDLWDNGESTPETAPTLWEDIAYREGIRIIPETITPGLAFAKGEQGWWRDARYSSKLDANVWTPEQNPAAWEKV